MSPRIVPVSALLHVPEWIRLPLARVAIWRKRRTRVVKTSMLALSLVCLSGVLGLVLAQPPVLPAYPEPEYARALLLSTDDKRSQAEFVGARQWGELQAEVVRLRLLYARIADAADLLGDEFALSLQLADERYLRSISVFEHEQQKADERFMLVKRTVSHMTEQAEIMLSISQRRLQDQRFALSGAPVARAVITSRFGYRVDPNFGKKRFHRGLDFGGPKGSEVMALADGIVTFAGKNGGYGNLVELEHANGYRTRYAHNEANLVSVGEKVDKRQVIATMGSTGKSTGTHVHLEVRLDGLAVDPLQFVAADS